MLAYRGPSLDAALETRLPGFSKVPPQLSWRATILSVSLVLALLFDGAWGAARNLAHAQQQIELRDQANNTELALSGLLSTLKDAETGQRGYLLTGDRSYLLPYLQAQGKIGAEFALLDAAPMLDDASRAAIARLRSLTAAKFDELNETVTLYDRGRQAAAIALVRSNRGERIMDQIRSVAGSQQAGIQHRLTQAEQRLPLGHSWLWVGMLLCAAVALLTWIVLQQYRTSRYFAISTYRLERFTRAFGLGLGLIRTSSGRITAWSQGSARLYGYTAEEAIGRISHQLLCTLFPTPLAEIEAQLQQDGYWRGELVHRRRDGLELRVLSHWALQKGAGGRNREDLVIEINSDVTSLARTDALLHTILETAPALIYAKDREGRMLLANPPTLELLGLPWEDVQGRTDQEILKPDEGAVIMENDRRLMEHARSEVVEDQVGCDPDGTPRIWSSCKAPMFNGSGAVIGLVGVSVEITAKRRADEQLRRQAAELERAYEDMGDFAHMIAHDLRAPLRAVKSLAEWIAEDLASVAGPESLADLALLRSRVNRMNLLLEGLLSFSRVGRDKAEPELVDPAAMVAEIQAMLAPPPGMAVRYAGESLIIRTPRPPLMHVLQNLVSNAIKHHDREQGEIVVTAIRTTGLVTFSVTDDGPGIPAGAHKKIFEMFQTLRAEAPTSGVGLAIVRKTVENHGGSVSVESDPRRRGARFTFTWPEPEQPAAPLPARHSSHQPSTADAPLV